MKTHSYLPHRVLIALSIAFIAWIAFGFDVRGNTPADGFGVCYQADPWTGQLRPALCQSLDYFPNRLNPVAPLPIPGVTGSAPVPPTPGYEYLTPVLPLNPWR